MAREERCERFGHGARVLELQEVRRAREDEALGPGQPVEKQPIRLYKAGMERGAPLTEHDEDGLPDAARLRFAEVPVEPSRKIRLEERRRIDHRLLDGAGKHCVEPLSVLRPAHLQELGDRNARACLVIPLPASQQTLPVQLRTLADQHSSLEQAQRPNELGLVQREPQADQTAEGVPDDVSTSHAEVCQQPPTVAGLL
jgi:hypothetical protein